MTRILIADDDPHLREVLHYALGRAGYEVRAVGDGNEALRAHRAEAADLIVLDVMMPGMDGLEACRELRRHSLVPIVFLSSRDEELDRILGLEIGGDDYMTKPFSPRELVSRIKAVLRRARPTGPPSPILSCGGIRLDPEAHRVHVGEVEILLTVTEFQLLHVLMTHPGRAYTREELTERAYGEGHHLADRTLDSHIRRIRHKFREVGRDPVETVHGLGYRLAPGGG